MKIQKFILSIFGIFLITQGCATKAETEVTLRIGHFPNLTHAQALVAHSQSRAGGGTLEKALGSKVKIEWYTYNAGPSAMEAILTDAIDIAYVGPNPVLNAYVRTKGRALKVISGSARGGAGLILRSDLVINSSQEFRGKKIATPQLGNTQDISARSYFLSQGFKITQLGGDVTLIPTSNADQLDLLMRGEIDGAWAVEPWLSLFELDANAKIFREDKNVLTTVVVASSRALSEKSDLIKLFLANHQDITRRLILDEGSIHKTISDELAAETSKGIKTQLFEHAWPRINFSTEILEEDFTRALDEAKVAGFMAESASAKGIIENGS